MSARDVTIGQVWERKRGRRHLPQTITVRQVHRPDRTVSVRFADGTVREVKLRALRDDYRPQEHS